MKLHLVTVRPLQVWQLQGRGSVAVPANEAPLIQGYAQQPSPFAWAAGTDPVLRSGPSKADSALPLRSSRIPACAPAAALVSPRPVSERFFQALVSARLRLQLIFPSRPAPPASLAPPGAPGPEAPRPDRPDPDPSNHPIRPGSPLEGAAP